MGRCSKRHFLLTVCVLQLLSTVERQVFDFLGYMWAPILLNFFNIIFVIFGFFGGYQYRPKYIITYSVWNLLWLAWNIFIICFYLSVGVLDKESSILNLGTGSISWWEANGPGCKADFSPERMQDMGANPYRPTAISDCLFQYEHVEIGHASWQCLLACLGFISGVCLSRIFIEEDDSFDFMAGDGKSPRHLALQPMYVSYSSLTPSSKRNSLSSIRRNQKHDQKTQSTTSNHTLDSRNRTRPRNVSSNSLNCIPPPYSVNYRKPFNKVIQTVDQLYDERDGNCEISYTPRSNIHNKSNHKQIYVDQIRTTNVEFRQSMSRSKSHDRLSRRVSNTPNTRPKSLCAKTSFLEH